MSGYGKGESSQQRVRDDGVPLIEKPFNRRTLLESVHRALTTPRKPSPG
jgi:FixJ family two-component response regulator